MHLTRHLPRDGALARELSSDGRIPSERHALATLDYLALNTEVADGTFRLLYRAHTNERSKQPDALHVPRQLNPKPTEPEPRRMTMREAFAQAERMSDGG